MTPDLFEHAAHLRASREARDICERKHGGNAESRAAYQKASPSLSAQRARVLAACSRSGGVTCKELAEEWGCGMNAISGRFSELKKRGAIAPTGSRRGGCAVLVATSSNHDL